MLLHNIKLVLIRSAGRFLGVELGASFSVLLCVELDEGGRLYVALLHLLCLGVVEKPVGEEVNRILRLRLPHHRHAFRNDTTQFFAL